MLWSGEVSYSQLWVVFCHSLCFSLYILPTLAFISLPLSLWPGTLRIGSLLFLYLLYCVLVCYYYLFFQYALAFSTSHLVLSIALHVAFYTSSPLPGQGLAQYFFYFLGQYLLCRCFGLFSDCPGTIASLVAFYTFSPYQARIVSSIFFLCWPFVVILAVWPSQRLSWYNSSSCFFHF